MSSEEWKKVGALWEKVHAGGDSYFSGEVELDGKKHRIVVLKNDYKKKDNHPDYVIKLVEIKV